MKILTKVILSVVALLLVAFGFYTYNSKDELDEVKVIQTASSTLKKFSKENEIISVNVTYPNILGSSKEITQANDFIKNEIDKKIESFENDAKESSQADIGLPKEIKSTVTGSPAVEESNDRYTSIFMGMEWYLRGSAHPSHSIYTYIYDYKKNSLVSINDLFKNGSDYLTVLSTLSKEDLLLQSKEGDLGYIYDESFVKEGTTPIKDNFAKILPLKDGLAIYFDEYQVAPYAAGPQQVVIPYAKLKDIINPDGVLGIYIK